MRLQLANLSIESKIWEFDVWVTPSLNEIKASDRYQLEMRRVLGALSMISTGGQLSAERYSADLVDRVNFSIRSVSSEASHAESLTLIKSILESLCALVFLATGKSDNNHKCQLPIFLKNQLGWESIPGVRKSGGSYLIVHETIPRVLDSERYMARVAAIYAAARVSKEKKVFDDQASLLLLEFVESIVSDSDSKQQLDAFLDSYRGSVAAGKDPSLLLASLITFQVRGSVSASGGHEPEQLLRKRMTEWGLRRDIDFNSNDVVVRSVDGADLVQTSAIADASGAKSKTRAFDFVIPFRTPGWKPRIFIQSQFYAGDSGSVSHKNVDQTAASRQSVLRLYEDHPELPPPLFVEYVDGAGYCASLNGDLRSLLSYDTTHDFFQIRSAPIRLRRVFQSIGLLTPLDLAHALMRTAGDVKRAEGILADEGYSGQEIERVIRVACDEGTLAVSSGLATIESAALPIIRQYLLLDSLANIAEARSSLADCSGCVLIPGYGPYHAVRLDEISSRLHPDLNSLLSPTLLTDLAALIDAGHARLH